MPRKPQVAIHIGTEKTGTTTLQQALKAGEPVLLRKHGVAYISTPGRADSRALAAACLSEYTSDEYLREQGVARTENFAEFREQVFDNVRTQIARLPEDCHTVIISSEHFHSRLRNRENLLQLKACLEPVVHQIRIICYLRRQVDLATSFYSTMLKTGRTETLEQSVRRTCHPRNHYYNYHALLELWSDVFGRDSIQVRRYDADSLRGGSVVADFLDQFAISVQVLGQPTRARNRSISPTGQALTRYLNTRIDATTNAATRRALMATRKGITRIFAGPGARLAPDVEAEIQSRFDATNAAVRDRWFPRDAALFRAFD